jgi:hypothetical protein
MLAEFPQWAVVSVEFPLAIILVLRCPASIELLIGLADRQGRHVCGEWWVLVVVVVEKRGEGPGHPWSFGVVL